MFCSDFKLKRKLKAKIQDTPNSKTSKKADVDCHTHDFQPLDEQDASTDIQQHPYGRYDELVKENEHNAPLLKVL